MTKEIKIEVPTGWEDVTLEEYLQLQDIIKNYQDDSAAVQAGMLEVLCKLPATQASSLSTADYKELVEQLEGFLGNTENKLQPFITIDGIEYGFEPNLSKMSYGAYLDIAKYETFTIDKNWANVMSILYRPVIKKDKHFYAIQPYTGKTDPGLFNKKGMDIHFGALFFFVNLSMDLWKDIQKSSKQQEKK